MIYVKGNTATLNPPLAGSEESMGAAVETPRRRQSMATPTRSAKKVCVQNTEPLMVSFEFLVSFQAHTSQ